MSLVHAWLVWTSSGRIRRRLQDPTRSIEDIWPAIRRIFGTATGVHRGRIGASARLTFEAEVLQLLAGRQDSEALFRRDLNDENPIVSAYCLLGLEMLREPALASLAQALFSRPERLVWRGSCFMEKLTLGELAKKTARKVMH